MEKERHYNTTVMFVDMAGYTARTSRLSRKELQDVLEEFESVVKPAISSFGGKIIKGMGDAFLATFHSPTNSVLCGIEIQKRIDDRNQKAETKEKFEARVGISSGEVYERGGDIFGEPVNLASRVQSLADAGQVIFSGSTFHAMNKNEFSIISLGEKSLKGISDKTEVYLANEKGKSAATTKVRAFFKRHKRKLWILSVILLIILFIAVTKNQGPRTLGDDWNNRANEAINSKNSKLMENLLKTYESSAEKNKDFASMLLAAKMYNSLGRNEMARQTIKSAIEKIQNQQQLDELSSLAKTMGFELPKNLQDRLNQKVV